MNKTKLIAISGLCAAVVVGCLVLSAYVPWLMILLGVIASVAVVIPIMIDQKNLWLTLLIYLAGSILGVFLGWAKATYIAPIVAFCIPFAIVKVYGERSKLSATVEKKNIFDDPFDDRAKIVKVQIDKKAKIPVFVRWILYYALLEIAIALTVLVTWIVSPSLLEAAVENWAFYVVLGALQIFPIPYNVLMNGCLIGAAKALKKALKP